MDKRQNLTILKEKMPDLYNQFGVKSIALFGSYSRDEAHEQSDVDLIVELEKKAFLYVRN
ncbi:MAG: hypothetical protein GF401_20460 [Chitinivibrionales bacterium]|nr:hypothetical protein [Chitinivibrionales bacterium]